MMTGEAAGTAAALAVRDQVTPAEISVKELQTILKQQNRLLPV
ncbi:FAD-dependent oxidoreductase [Hungatella sp.]